MSAKRQALFLEGVKVYNRISSAQDYTRILQEKYMQLTLQDYTRILQEKYMQLTLLFFRLGAVVALEGA